MSSGGARAGGGEVEELVLCFVCPFSVMAVIACLFVRLFVSFVFSANCKRYLFVDTFADGA